MESAVIQAGARNGTSLTARTCPVPGGCGGAGRLWGCRSSRYCCEGDRQNTQESGALSSKAGRMHALWPGRSALGYTPEMQRRFPQITWMEASFSVVQAGSCPDVHHQINRLK